FENALVMGIIFRGTATRLINPALSTSEVVPLCQASAKKLNGTMPHSRKTVQCGVEFLKILVKTNVYTPSITRGFSSDHSTLSAILRKRTTKSFSTRFINKKG